MLNNAYNSEDPEVRAAFLHLLPWWTEQARLGLKSL
jgi:hypothetical protein